MTPRHGNAWRVRQISPTGARIDGAAADLRPLNGRATRRRRGAVLAVVGAALALGVAMPTGALAASTAPAPTDGSTTAPCTGGAWPAAVQGTPIVRAGTLAGDHLWHDATGWHLRVTHVGSARVVFSGTIRSNRPLHVSGYRLERGDTVTLSADRLSATYRFVNHGRVDGLNFTTECATRLAVGGRMNGALLPVRRVWLGRAGRHPLQNPFILLRRA